MLMPCCHQPTKYFQVFCIPQAERWGAELITEDVEAVDLQQRPFIVRTSDTEVCPGTLMCRELLHCQRVYWEHLSCAITGHTGVSQSL